MSGEQVSSSMKAALCPRYGPPEGVHLAEVPTPQPGPREVLVAVRATTVSSGDWRLRSLAMPPGFELFARLAFGWRGPRQPILGTELAGRVVAVGAQVRRFAVGDRVFAHPGAAMACHAEFRCVAEDGPIAAIPDGIDDTEAAALSFGGATALAFLRRGGVGPGQQVLVNGASGAVGSAAVQLARHFGARVTAVASAGRAGLLRTLGAHDTIDYACEDFADGRRRWDVIVDTVGNAGWQRGHRALAPDGRLLLVMCGLPDLLRMPWVALRGHQRIVAGDFPPSADDLHQLATWAAQGVWHPVIDRCLPFDQIVEAHRIVAAGHKQGSVVLTLDPPSLPPTP